MENNFASRTVSEYLLYYWGVINKLKWSTKTAEDSVNHTLFRYVFSTMLKINDLYRFKYFDYLVREIEKRARIVFPNITFRLWECFVQKYSKDSSYETDRVVGALVKHVDGGLHSHDLASFVYTVHLGEGCVRLLKS